MSVFGKGIEIRQQCVDIHGDVMCPQGFHGRKPWVFCGLRAKDHPSTQVPSAQKSMVEL